MLFTQCSSRAAAGIALCALIIFQLPARAEINIQADENAFDTSKAARSVINSAAGLTIAGVKDSPVNNQLACATCGCNELCAVTSVESSTIKHTDPSLLTDSLWGNLILEMAYQRDKEVQRLVKKLNTVNLVTMGAIAGITAGTLAQGITALYTLNPPDGHLDSYAPGIVGTSLSGLTMLTFGSRMYFSHKYQKKLKARQLAIKDSIEEILRHLEYSEAKCPELQKQLAELIGERACGEFLQLWQSSHQLATASRENISELNTINVLNGKLAKSIP